MAGEPEARANHPIKSSRDFVDAGIERAFRGIIIVASWLESAHGDLRHLSGVQMGGLLDT
jgi:hypothetical protein